jgi:hypothetical protein
MAKDPTPSKVDEERLAQRDDGHDGGRRDGDNFGEHERATRAREQDHQLTDPERRRAIQRRVEQLVLPSLPEKGGWHRCWVSTTHPLDTPERRLRAGYTFVREDDVRGSGWMADRAAIKDAEQVEGKVRWRELVLMEIPVVEYNEYMREFHHDMPYDMTQGIFSGLDEMGDKAKSKGGKVTLEEGMEQLRRRIQTPPPRQFEN